eukprot:CAMPEP_0116848800 /NCGR_PEP_ID=MMETSP0418-20121206/15211_1 /TAXON_ID=1158023 /ORGANISM="Astrosyne radiata, Strain 13vi08-1A" /LENGTH=120 /DNA_ID=CAMNT_0004480437 /DNA_START=495 /DNA_END=854 /DNA_ORIENTATION=-
MHRAGQEATALSTNRSSICLIARALPVSSSILKEMGANPAHSEHPVHKSSSTYTVQEGLATRKPDKAAANKMDDMKCGHLPNVPSFCSTGVFPSEPSLTIVWLMDLCPFRLDSIPRGSCW